MNTSSRRRAAMVLGLVLVPIALVVIWYSPLGTTIVFETARNVMKWEVARDHRRAMADTYGGKTPEETIRMYLDAFAKRDYVFASKYFIEQYREEQEHAFDKASEENLRRYESELRESLARGGEYDWTGEFFIIDKPLYVRMKIYPNGIWKLLEI